MSHKADVLAYDREKRVYKDAYVDNFRRVRHFPALAAIGAGRSDGDSIILVQDATPANSAPPPSTKAPVASRLMPTNPVEEMFSTTPPLTSFRTAVMCKHTNARREAATQSPATDTTASELPPSSGFAPRYRTVSEKVGFRLACPADAKAAIARSVAYDNEAFRDRAMIGREMSSPQGKPEWAYNNPAVAKEGVRTRTYFYVPPEGVVTANRRYTQDFIDQHVQAYERSRQHATRTNQTTS